MTLRTKAKFRIKGKRRNVVLGQASFSIAAGNRRTLTTAVWLTVAKPKAKPKR